MRDALFGEGEGVVVVTPPYSENLYTKNLEEKVNRLIGMYGENCLKVARARFDLANKYSASGRPMMAKNMFEKQVLPCLIANYGEGGADVTRVYSLIAAANLDLGNFTEAYNILELKVLPPAISALGERHLEVAHAKLDLARAYMGLQNYEAAHENVSAVLEIYEERVGREHNFYKDAIAVAQELDEKLAEGVSRPRLG